MLKVKRKDRMIHKRKKKVGTFLSVWDDNIRKETELMGWSDGGTKDDKQNINDLYFMF